MFSSKLPVVLRLKTLAYHVSESTICCKQRSQFLCTCTTYNYTSCSYYPAKRDTGSTPFFVRNYCIQRLPENVDVFGGLGYNSHELVEMDEEEKEEEEFTENEISIPKWQKLSPGQYAALIKSHINKGDLMAALNVLDTIKQNRDKPNQYMYNLLIRAFAVQGDISKSFKLYSQMKKRGLIPNDATYNSLLNACATSKNTKKALEHLNNLRQLFYEKKYPLNQTHYNTMIKAYGWHGETYKAFELVDEMIDKGVYIGSITYCVLLQATISNKKAGLRYALMIWHMMQWRKIRRNIFHYNLFLRAIRDTNLGILTVNDTFLPGVSQTQICLSETEKPNLLASPPILSSLSVAATHLQSKMDSASCTLNVTDPITLSSQINDILEKNRLLLFGGFENILEQMEKDGVQPDEKTMTLLIELLPNSVVLEDYFIDYVHSKKIKLDVYFYNSIMKKRALRYEYDAATAVLDKMQRDHLSPDIVTFGVLALGCRKQKDGFELLEGMETFGYVPNFATMGALLSGACHEQNFEYVLKLLQYMVNRKMKLNDIMLERLKKFDTEILQLLQKRDKRNHSRIQRMKEQYKTYAEKSKKLIEKMQAE